MTAKPILVTGSHRSGTTWTGRMLAASPAVGYIWEPFHLGHRAGECAASFVFVNTCVTEANEAEFLPHFRRTLNFQYRFFQGLSRIRRVQDVYNLAMGYGSFLYHRTRNSRPLLKDPRAIFSAEWLASRFNADVVLTVRHPAALAGSLKMTGWRFPFADLLSQPLLMEAYLGDFRDEMTAFAETEQDIVDQAALLWKLVYHTVSGYRERHPEWLFVRHEDLSRNPLKGFKRIYDHVDLDFSDEVVEKIRLHCGLSGGSAPSLRKVDPEVMRNSAAGVFNWKDRLTRDEVARVKERTGKVAQEFYDEEDWLMS